MIVFINVRRGLNAVKAPLEDDTQWVRSKTSRFSSLLRVVLDMGSTEIPVHGQQENSAYRMKSA